MLRILDEFEFYFLLRKNSEAKKGPNKISCQIFELVVTKF